MGGLLKREGFEMGGQQRPGRPGAPPNPVCLDLGSREHGRFNSNLSWSLFSSGCDPMGRESEPGSGGWEACAGRYPPNPGHGSCPAPSQRSERSAFLGRPAPSEPAPSMSLGDRIRMCSSQGRMLRRRWSSSSSPSGLASQAATPGEESGLKGSQGGSKTSHSAKDTFRPGWGLSQMPTKGTETDPSGDFRQRPHCPPAQVEGSKQDWEAAGLLSAPGRDRPGQAPHWEKEGWGFEAGQM